MKGSDVNEDEDIDIITVEKDSAFSDSDMSQEEIRFLPAYPCTDVLELEDGHAVNTLKERDFSGSESPLSEEAGQNGHLTNHDSSPHEGNLFGY